MSLWYYVLVSAEKKRHPFFKSKIAKATAIGAALTTAVVGVKAYEHRELLGLYADLTISHVQDRTIIDFTEQTDPNITRDRKFIDSYNLMNRNFGVDNDLLLSSEHGWTYASAWPYGRAIDACYVATLLPNIGDSYKEDYQKRLNAAQRYWNTDPEGYPPGYDPGLRAWHGGERIQRYVDDNLWIGAMLARDYRQSGNKDHLEKAQEIFDLAISQWDEKGGGGIFLKEQLPGETERQKPIVSNGNAIILAVDLYEQTKDKRYLDWAEKILKWTDENLKDDSEGIYSDALKVDKLERAKFTYNQGIMVGALTKLNGVDPEKYPLKMAFDVANSALDYFNQRGYDNPSFDSVFFRGVLYFAGKYDNPEFTQKAHKSLVAITDKLAGGYQELSTHASATLFKALEILPPDQYKLLL